MSVIATISTTDPDVFEAVWNAVRGADVPFTVQFTMNGVELVAAAPDPLPTTVYRPDEAAAPLELQVTVDPPAHLAPATAPVSCSHCGRAFDKPHGLTVHLRRSDCGKITRVPFDQDKARARAAAAI